jgi:hypothetical protein
MGLLKLFARRSPPHLLRLPSGSFTVDNEGEVISSTLPKSFPRAYLRQIASQMLATFRAAHQAELPLVELNVRYASLKILARRLHRGLIIFLVPYSLTTVGHKPRT